MKTIFSAKLLQEQLKVALLKLDSVTSGHDFFIRRGTENIENLNVFAKNSEESNEENSEDIVEEGLDQSNTNSQSFDKDSLSINPKSKLKSRVRALFFDFNSLDENGNTVTDMFGIPVKIDFNTAYTFCLFHLAGKKPNFDTQLNILKEKAKLDPIFNQFVKHLEHKITTSKNPDQLKKTICYRYVTE
jgi:hypothetical protein